MPSRKLTRSFAGGEITPELYGRLDLANFQAGVSLCRNLIVLAHGPATRRPGLKHVVFAKYKQTDPNSTVRYIPFQFNVEQSYVIELGHQYARFHTQGGTVLEATQSLTTITAANPPVVTYAGTDPADGDWVYITGVAGMTEVNNRYFIVTNVDAGSNTFELTDPLLGLVDASGWTAGTGGTMAPVHEIATPYSADDLAVLKYEQSADVLTLVHPDYATRLLNRTTATSFTLTTEDFGTSVDPPTNVVSATSGSGGGNPSDHIYAVTSLTQGGEESLPSPPTAVLSFDLSVAGNTIDITWTAEPAAERYNVYEIVNGVPGLIGQAIGTSFVDDNIEPDFSSAYPQADDTLDGADYYPGAVSYFEQRKVFGGSNNEPISFYMTQTGTEANLTRRVPPDSADRVVGRLVSREVNEIRHFVPLTDLLVFTSGSEWVLSSADGNAVSATTLLSRAQSYHGSAHVRPVVTGNSVIYLQAAGRRTMAIAYSDDQRAYVSRDVSILAPHLVDEYTIVDMDYETAPDQIVWAVRSDGTLLGLTYVPDQEVVAWHRHTTNGKFTSVAVVTEGTRYVAYFGVQRTINGQQMQSLEFMEDRAFTDLEDWFGVDAGATYDGAEAKVITGLWHLEGEEVEILADGAVVPPQTVANGSITLTHGAQKVHVGLAYRPMLIPLPLTYERAEAGGYGRLKNVVSVHLRVNKSSGVAAGKDENTLRIHPQRTTEPYGSPPAMLSEEIEIQLDGNWSADGLWAVSNEGPLPLTLISATAEVSFGG